MVRHKKEDVKDHLQASSKFIFWLGWLRRWMVRPLIEMQTQKEVQVGGVGKVVITDGIHHSRKQELISMLVLQLSAWESLKHELTFLK